MSHQNTHDKRRAEAQAVVTEMVMHIMPTLQKLIKEGAERIADPIDADSPFERDDAQMRLIKAVADVLTLSSNYESDLISPLQLQSEGHVRYWLNGMIPGGAQGATEG